MAGLFGGYRPQRPHLSMEDLVRRDAGIAGIRSPYETPGIGDGIREMQMGLPSPGMAPAKRGLMTRLGIKPDQVWALGALLQGDTQAVGDFHQKQQLPLLQQAQREAEFSDFRRRHDYERANPKPSIAQPYRFEDNAGNVWELGPDGRPFTRFVDPNDKQFIQDGQLITVPNRLRSTPPQAAGGEERKTIGGTTYVRRGNDWYEESAGSNAGGGFR